MSYSNGPRVVTDGLVCYFDFGNTKSYPGAGNSAFDLTSNNSAATNNSPTFSDTNKGSLYLNGTNQRIVITPKASTIRNYDSTTFLTIKLPVYSGAQRCIMSYRGSGGGGDLYIGKQSNGIFIYYDQLNTPGLTVGSLIANNIYHVCVLCDATNSLLSVYINGALTAPLSRTGFVSSYATSAIYLGYDNGGTAEYMIGDFYNFQHYNRVLSASEISQNYSAIKGRFNL
jgi:hypothetical protein